MNAMLRNGLLAAVLSASAPAWAQGAEDPPVPESAEDEAGTEAVEPEPVEPTVDEIPRGVPEPVEAKPSPPAETQAPPAAAPPAQVVSDAVHPAAAEPPPVEEEPRLRTAFGLRSEGATANNLDFRPLNNETFIDIYDSDDRGTLLFTRLSADIGYDVVDDTTVNIAASHTGAWGGDSIGAANAFGGVFYVNAANVNWRPIEGEGFTFGTTIGRQRFSVGGAKHDFFFQDVIDGVVVETGFGKGGKLRLLPIDLYALQRPDDFTFGAALGYAGPDVSSSAVGFDGDTNTTRFGGVYENTEMVDGLEIRLFGFYADIGAGAAPHTGADRVFYGAHGNFSDNDYNWMGGTRIGYTLDGESFDLGIYGEFAQSGGVDRKPTQIGVRDVTASGSAFGGAVTPALDMESLDIRFIVQFFMAQGGQYTGEEGLLFNYGFVSFKGAQAGGLNTSTFAGWHPSAYVGTRGVHHSPQDVSRKAGTMMLHGGAGFDIVDKLHIDLDGWFFKDTGVSFLDGFDDLGTIADELPFGYTEADLIPQERLGKPLGTELNLQLGFDPSEALALHVRGGMLLPGAFYKIEIPRTGGTALGAESPATFWAVTAGATVSF